MDGRHLVTLSRVPRTAALRGRDQGVRAGSRRGLQLHRKLARRNRCRDLRRARRHAESDPGPAAGVDRLLQQRPVQHGRQLHRVRRRRAQHPRVQKPVRQFRARCAERPADVRRPGLLLPERGVQHAWQWRRPEIRRHAGGSADVSEHVHRGGQHGRRLVERPPPEQPVPRCTGVRADLFLVDVHELLDIGLQRVPAQSQGHPFICLELTATRSRCRLRLQEEADRALVQDACRIQQGDGPGGAQRPAGLQHLRTRDDAGRVGPAASLQS